MLIRALIIEDEPLARQSLRDFASEFGELEIVGEAFDGLTAVRLINALEPDLVFLDVQIPEISGLEVLRRITYHPTVVFTTAFENYAIAAFELEAFDYLLKPFGRERFSRTIERVLNRLAEQNDKQIPHQKTAKTSLDEINDSLVLSRLFVRDKDRVVPLQVGEIVWLEADDDYTIVHTEHKKYLVNTKISEFASRLPAEKFLRVHRSSIVNLDFVTEIEEQNRRLLLFMSDGAVVQASRTGSQILKKLIA